MLKEKVIEEIEKRGFLLVHNLDGKMTKYVRRLLHNGTLIGCDKIEKTKSAMNASYHVTYKNNPFDLVVVEQHLCSWIGKGT